jgi:hypothetical protein
MARPFGGLTFKPSTKKMAFTPQRPRQSKTSGVTSLSGPLSNESVIFRMVVTTKNISSYA